jgi:hypothetical protein
MSRRDREMKRRQDRFAPGTAPGIIVGDQDERREPVVIPRAPPAADLAPPIRTKPPIWD